MRHALFLHYGPGGNCDVERAWLSSKWPGVEFWDQPKTQSFAELRAACIDKVKEFSRDSEQINLIGHSFGCDLVSAVLTELPNIKANCTFISPILSLYDAFANLGARILLQQDLDTEYKIQLKSAVDALKSQPNIENLWAAIGKMVEYKDFAKLYWCSNEKFTKYTNDLKSCLPFDFVMWQTVLTDYIKNYSLNLPKNIVQLKIIMGEQDPYLHCDEACRVWRMKCPQAIIETVGNTGHYPHLESDLFN